MNRRRNPSWTYADSLARLEAGGRFDVAIVGGGVIGAAAALDAASRGLSVVLVEQGDFADRQNLVFVHTGGSASLPVYGSVLGGR